MGKTTIVKILREIAAEQHYHMRGTEFESDIYGLEGGWETTGENHAHLQITAYKNMRIVFKFIYIDHSVPEEKVTDMLRFFAYLNEESVYSTYTMDLRDDNAIESYMLLNIGRVEEFLPTKYSNDIKAWFLRMLELGLDNVDKLHPYIQRIIDGNENPDELALEFIKSNR